MYTPLGESSGGFCPKPIAAYAPERMRSAKPTAEPAQGPGAPGVSGRGHDAKAADLIQAYEARIAALERLVGKQALELEFLKGALRSGQSPRSAPTSVIIGPAGSPSRKDVG